MKLTLTIRTATKDELKTFFPNFEGELATKGSLVFEGKTYNYELLCRDDIRIPTGNTLTDDDGHSYLEMQTVEGCFTKIIVDESFCAHEVVPKSYWITTDTKPSILDLDWKVPGLKDQCEINFLEDIKAKARKFINAERDRIHYEGIEYNGYTYQTDEQSISDIMGAIITGTDTTWLTTDNVTVQMTASEMQQLGNAIAERKKLLVYKAREFKDTVETLLTPSAIDEYIFNLDWSA